MVNDPREAVTGHPPGCPLGRAAPV